MQHENTWKKEEDSRRKGIGEGIALGERGRREI
jgi:hypothetical protein